MSRRFAMKKYLGLSDEEIVENERMWREENGDGSVPGQDLADNLNSVGVRPMDTDAMDIGGDTDIGGDDADAGDDGTASPITGDEQASPEETT
jgi:hypothetical protein